MGYIKMDDTSFTAMDMLASESIPIEVLSDEDESIPDKRERLFAARKQLKRQIEDLFEELAIVDRQLEKLT